MVASYPGIRTPVIIGAGQRTIEVTETVTHGPIGYTDQLQYAATSIIKVGDYPDQYKYFEDTDFIFNGTSSTPSKDIIWSPSGAGTKEPGAGDTYFVTYLKPVDDTQYDYHLYTNENDIIYRHGPESSFNLATVGGTVVLRNGCQQVGIIQLNLEEACSQSYPQGDPDNPTPAEWYLAFMNVLPILKQLDTEQCRYIVPMTTLGDEPGELAYDIFNEYLFHVDEMSLVSQRRWRMLIRGKAATVSAANGVVRDAFSNQAKGYRSHNSARRMIVVAPGEVYRIIRDPITGLATKQLFDGSVLAAAAAGRICAFDNPAIPITWKDFAGITLSRIFSNADMNNMAGNGVCVFWYKGESLKCRHGITCDLTNANTQEISVVEVEDFIKVQSIYVLEDRYIGSLIVSGLTDSIKATLMAHWESLIKRQVIADFDQGSISVSQNVNDPRVIDIYGRVKPAYPLNWIYIRFMFYAGPTT
jgi:hypothetical protein